MTDDAPSQMSPAEHAAAFAQASRAADQYARIAAKLLHEGYPDEARRYAARYVHAWDQAGRHMIAACTDHDPDPDRNRP